MANEASLTSSISPGNRAGARQLGDFPDVRDRSAGASRAGQQIERTIVLANRRKRLIHISPCIAVACNSGLHHQQPPDGDDKNRMLVDGLP